MSEFLSLFECDESEELLPVCLPPECADGNVEYKLKLINPSQSRFEHLVTQMKWRLREGQGEAIYEIGVEDKGMLIGLTEDEVDASLHTLYMMAEKLGASLTILRERVVTPDGCAPCRKVLEILIRKIESLLKSPACKKIPFNVVTEDDAITSASSMAKSNITPIFAVSCVSGQGLNLLYTFLNVLSPCVSVKEREKLVQQNAEFQVDEIFNVSDVGLVVGGLLVSGIIRENDWLHIGPLVDGSFSDVQVASVHRHKVPCRVVRAGESASLALTNTSTDLTSHVRKGMVLISIESNRTPYPVCYYFQARIHVLFHATMICPGFQTTVHVKNIRQTAVVVAIMGKRGITTNETASVMLRFLKQPEYVTPGCPLLFREGMSKGIGQVIQVFPVDGTEPITFAKKQFDKNQAQAIPLK
ncbi:GTP-binding protein 2-like protein [Dinothrombium tinctorium]|uniref:GTP-binding protein 2-like protein n=1 Tax=Dinothrombium tinctorium TaxID=1965070 RepID=A0A3S3S817_9ACAR|nr:GTP-binding protein 2-like protein [Dinothrombium tinctorium]RWS10495.1 GTP-binding protein 2-like protein [Dinothrombium tinctorium]